MSAPPAVSGIQAGSQTGTGPNFAGDLDSNVKSWPFSKLAFGDFQVDYNIVYDGVGHRLPVKSSPDTATATDGGAAIAIGGTAQQVFPANPARKGGFVQNPITAIEILYVNYGLGAPEDYHSRGLNPGDVFDFNEYGVVVTDAVWVNAPTAGHTFTAKSYA